MAWDVLSGAAKMAWDVLSVVTKTAQDVLSGVANRCGMFCPGWQKMAWDVLSRDVLSYILNTLICEGHSKVHDPVYQLHFLKPLNWSFAIFNNINNTYNNNNNNKINNQKM